MNRRADVVIAGASLGGTVAAWQAAAAGHRVLLVASEPWLGGQFTAQAVPADEHAAIERGGASATYLAFREALRAQVRAQPGFVDRTTLTEGCNPGDGWVSRLCIEPALAAQGFEQMLAPQVAAGRLGILRGARVQAVHRDGRRIASIRVRLASGEPSDCSASVFVDATDTGELLALAGLAYRIGKESQAEFGERDAPPVADPLDQQPVTWVMALRRHARAVDGPPAPPGYRDWAERRVPHFGHALFSELIPGSRRGESARLPLFAGGATLDAWRYRRIVSRAQWRAPRDEVSLINWAQNDYALHPLIDGPLTTEQVQDAARALSRALLHWLRTEAPREDGGRGHPELSLATDMLGTPDGLAQQVYVRESRRMVTVQTLTQNELLADPAAPFEPFHHPDSVGVAWYNMDIHPTCRSGHGVNARVRPFTLPLASFVAGDVDNLLPGCKNIGVTHLVNACTRVHPVEWLVGEVAAHLAHRMLITGLPPRAIHSSSGERQSLQARLIAHGVPLAWENAWLEGLAGAPGHG